MTAIDYRLFDADTHAEIRLIMRDNLAGLIAA
jgi:hypothetical protein